MSNQDQPGPTRDQTPGSRPGPQDQDPLEVLGSGATKVQTQKPDQDQDQDQNTHHWVRIGPYLKCSRCGDLKAAPTEEDQ